MARVGEPAGFNHRRSAASLSQFAQPRPARSPLSRTAFYNSSCQEFIVSNLLGSYNQNSHISQTPSHSTSHGKHGTPESFRDALPISRYRDPSSKNNASKRKRSSKSRQCIICLENLKKNQLVRWLPCVHTFHVNCIDSWLRNSTKCPVCQCDVQHPTVSSKSAPPGLTSNQKATVGDQTSRPGVQDSSTTGDNMTNSIRGLTHEETASNRRRQPTISVSKLMMYAGASSWRHLNTDVDRRKIIQPVSGV